jgi:hypothetical protein
MLPDHRPDKEFRLNEQLRDNRASTQAIAVLHDAYLSAIVMRASHRNFTMQL